MLVVMMKKLRYLILFVGFFCFSLGVYAYQTQELPEPKNKSHTSGGPGPCGQPDQGGGVPPPVGLCLPINDYLLPLLITGILFGAYKVKNIQRS